MLYTHSVLTFTSYGNCLIHACNLKAQNTFIFTLDLFTRQNKHYRLNVPMCWVCMAFYILCVQKWQIQKTVISRHQI